MPLNHTCCLYTSTSKRQGWTSSAESCLKFRQYMSCVTMLCTYIYIYICTCDCMYIYIYMYIKNLYVCMYACIYIYIYIYMTSLGLAQEMNDLRQKKRMHDFPWLHCWTIFVTFRGADLAPQGWRSSLPYEGLTNDRQMTDKWHLSDKWQTNDRHMTHKWQTNDRQMTDSQTFGRHLADKWQTNDRQMTDNCQTNAICHCLYICNVICQLSVICLSFVCHTGS